MFQRKTKTIIKKLLINKQTINTEKKFICITIINQSRLEYNRGFEKRVIYKFYGTTFQSQI